jgi:hypothetical protein
MASGRRSLVNDRDHLSVTFRFGQSRPLINDPRGKGVKECALAWAVDLASNGSYDVPVRFIGNLIWIVRG